MEEMVEERLSELLTVLEAVAARLGEQQTDAGTIVATVASAREEELERKLAEAEIKLARLEAVGSSGRKTASVGQMFAKEEGERALTGALDGALQSLSVEQRIAVKAELMRTGVL